MKLQLHYPVKPHVVTQTFGDSSACTENNALPITKRRVTSKILGMCLPGYVELYPLLGMKGHTGMDIRATHGHKLYHCGPAGFVNEVQTEPERGLGIGIVSHDKYDLKPEWEASQVKLRYWHLKSIGVKLGDYVKTGDLIGECDNTGLSSGDHLHLELKPISQNHNNGVYSNIFQDNGYFGSIDPAPYFTGEYAEQQKTVTETEPFLTDMRFAQSSQEIKRLQKVLTELGYFTYPEQTGNYREQTRAAVFNFQLDYVDLSMWEFMVLRGKSAGSKTRAALNKIINN